MGHLRINNNEKHDNTEMTRSEVLLPFLHIVLNLSLIPRDQLIRLRRRYLSFFKLVTPMDGMTIIGTLLHGLKLAFEMGLETWWALILGLPSPGPLSLSFLKR